MIHIKVGTRFLELGDSKITIEIFNQLLQIGILKDNFSYSFQIPYSELNEQILGSAGRIASTDMHQNNFDCELWVEGVLWTTGVLIIEEASSERYYKIKLDFDFGSFADALGDKTLTECLTLASSGTQTITETNTNYRFFSINAFFAPDPGFIAGTVSYEILIDGTVYGTYVETPTSTLMDIAQGLANSFNSNGAINANWVAYAFVPPAEGVTRITLLPTTTGASNTVYYRVSQAEIFPGTGFSQIDYNFTNIAETRPVLSPAYTHIVFPFIKATQFYGNENEDFLGTLNDYDTAYFFNTLSQFVAPLSTPDNYNDYSHSPSLYLHSVINWIVQSVNWTWEGDFKTNAIFQTLLIYSNYASDAIDATNIPPEFEFNRHQRVILYSTLVPNMTAKEFFEQIQEIFCLYYTFDATNKVIRIDFKKDVFDSATTQSIRTKYKPIREIVERKKNIQLQYDTDLNIANYYPPAPLQGTYTKTETISVRAGAMPHEYPASPALWVGKGNSPMFGLGEKNDRDKMYFFFWRGIQTVEGQNKPVAEGKSIYGTGSLAWNEYLYTLWSAYINYLLYNKLEEGIIWLDIDDIRKALRSLALKYEYENLPFFIENIQTEIDSQTQNIVGAKIKLRKIPL